MQRSSARILTTHTGSLPRPPALVQLVAGQEQREVHDHPVSGGGNEPQAGGTRPSMLFV